MDSDVHFPRSQPPGWERTAAKLRFAGCHNASTAHYACRIIECPKLSTASAVSIFERAARAVMAYDDRPLDETTRMRLRLIEDYVSWQQRLIAEAVAHLDPAASEFDFRNSLPGTINVDGTVWSTTAHGVGVEFVNAATGVVVDAHVGFLDAPTAFDAWRLVQYCESLVATSEDFESWQDTLKTLAESGIADRYAKYDAHYTLNSDRVTQMLTNEELNEYIARDSDCTFRTSPEVAQGLARTHRHWRTSTDRRGMPGNS